MLHSAAATNRFDHGLFPSWLKRKQSNWSLRSFTTKMSRLQQYNVSTVSLPLSVESSSSSFIIPPPLEEIPPLPSPPSYDDKSHPWAAFEFLPKSLTNRTIEPREEEGKEVLPDYECTIQKMTYLKIKCEYSKPGIKSKSRSWKYLYLQIYGTKIMAFVQNPQKIRSYRISPIWSHSMYGAEITNAIDYLKERHVIRLKIAHGGPQYLLVVPTEKERNDWIMTMESSMNISSDLDERSMPQFITLMTRRAAAARRSRANIPIIGGQRSLTVDEQRQDLALL